MSGIEGNRCEEVQEVLAELALGIMSGRERSEVLAHLESCQPCAATLAEHSLVVDTLVQLALSAEPPLGFEQRLVQRLRPDPGTAGVGVGGAGAGTTSAQARRLRQRLRRLHAPLLVTAAAAAVALGFGIARWTGGAPARPAAPGHRGGALASAELRSGAHVMGEVYVAPGSPSWMFMTVDAAGAGGAAGAAGAGGWRNALTCELTLVGGHVETVGHFSLTGGSGAWAVPISVPAGDVRGAQLVSATGTVVASARLGA
ncbi:MAG TPA: zf-HC2 domain-containing protein [Acidimicrobiales bacterium]|nr:zf-HC2 domain-containing protein [Acidimicrobiales bacterium]